ncbi:LysM peptidoglycan-binding domain-containing protein [Hymenobacter volaticus]|uniref:LysM peptidoglycan-binding domain-containing protein n=1 Tax=Hymenobacter volaticus TaxID=2932254 RepID=A0ABY4G3G2_9BACT|nr:LysM peptidoglycan-binding domain-containing protein [Hymenobacter volaticus]UOQ65425.1 LysM peptidoglycan-binding domain-containing protein [Hymenobacter volaticus]
MKRILFTLFCCWPLLVGAQSVSVPAQVAFAGLHLRLTDGGRKAVQQKVDALRSHPTSFQARVNLADAYFPIIDRVLQEEAVPLDFRYLVVQESGLQGDAQSIHDAVGYWQFKRETAQDYGLLMNDVVDERKHIVASTHAAAKYLKRNNNSLHNWVDALLSYNLGSGGVKSYTLPTNFDATEVEITEQTHPYILTTLAHKLAYEPAVGHNPKPPLAFQEFPAPAGFTLVNIAQTLQTDPAEMARHNRWLLTTKVPSDKIYTILVPVVDEIQRTAIAAQQRNATSGQLLNKPQIDPQNADYVRVNGIRALIALPGDTKESLAQRAGLKMRKFMQYNDMFAFDNIVPGQPYFVQKKRDKAASEYHVAQPGESVATVSQKYGIRTRAILSKNRMPRNEELRAGRILWLQHTRPRDVAVEYADSKNATALAAFERPATASATATPQPASSTAPQPAAKKRRIDETEPYRGKTADATRVLEDAPEATDTTATTQGLVTQPDSATDATTENLNNLPPATETADTATVSAPEPTPDASAPRTVYSGQPVKEPSPAPAPIIEEPSSDTVAVVEPAPAPAKPVVKPTAPVAASPKPAPSIPSAPAPKPAAPAPVASATVPPTAPATSSVERIPANGLHVVQAKEGIYSVARRYGLRPADLMAWNNLPPNSPLQLGQALRLTAPQASASVATTPVPSPDPTPAPKPSTSTPVSKPAITPAPAAPTAAPVVIRHTVAAGESMYAVSRKYEVTIKQIMEWNNKPDFNVRPGDVLIIKPAKQPQTK